MKLCMGCMRENDRSLKICPYCGYPSGKQPEKAFFLMPGSELKGNYIVGKSIGNGGFGITYIGYDKRKRRRVAIKEFFPGSMVVRPDSRVDSTVRVSVEKKYYEKGLYRFMEEAQKQARFSGHHTMVEFYDYFMENGTGYIVMEYLVGYTIKDYMKKHGCFQYHQALDITLRVLQGLEAVHQVGLIHRDISPDNIFIKRDGTVKLLDFGAARYAAMDTDRQYSIILKHGYAPPEQYSTNGRQGPWTDVYAVGATFYRMITGVIPDESFHRMIEGENAHPLRKPSEMGIQINRQSELVLMKSLSLKIEDRIKSAEQFRQLLISAERGEDISSILNRNQNGSPIDNSGKDIKREKDYKKPDDDSRPQEKKKGMQTWIKIVIPAAVMAWVFILGMGVNLISGKKTDSGIGMNQNHNTQESQGNHKPKEETNQETSENKKEEEKPKEQPKEQEQNEAKKTIEEQWDEAFQTIRSTSQVGTMSLSKNPGMNQLLRFWKNNGLQFQEEETLFLKTKYQGWKSNGDYVQVYDDHFKTSISNTSNKNKVQLTVDGMDFGTDRDDMLEELGISDEMIKWLKKEENKYELMGVGLGYQFTFESARGDELNYLYYLEGNNRTSVIQLTNPNVEYTIGFVSGEFVSFDATY